MFFIGSGLFPASREIRAGGKKNRALRRVFPGVGEAGKISGNLNTGVLILFMPDKPDEIIKIVSIYVLTKKILSRKYQIVNIGHTLK